MNRPSSVLIVGAGLAGTRCAETLRAEGYDGQITLVGDEPVAPYERPALSKEFLAGKRTPDQLLLRAPTFWIEHEIELVLGRHIQIVEPTQRQAIVVATGARPRRPAIPGALQAHVLRTLTDAITLRGEFRPGRRLAIVGGGFIGAEVASTALALGVEVTIFEAGPTPFGTALGTDVGDILARRYRRHGVDLQTDATASALHRNGVLLTDGRAVRSDVVLLAIGAAPASELLRDDVEACGDVKGGAGHWMSAAADGVGAARRILNLEPLPPQPPFFWSDQFGLRLQLVGDPRVSAAVELDGSEEGFTARYLAEDGRLVAALAANRSANLAGFRRELAFAA
jgi:NADPH-dependent 2,4-dienoyl-CoA reductase/sulfur reductase-like enzyme